MLRNRLLQLPRQSKRALQVFADILLLWAALWLAFLVRLGLAGMIDPFGEYLWLFIAAPASFSRLSESDRRALVEAARVGATAMRKRVTEVEFQALEALKQEGVIVESEIDKARFQAALAPAYTDYAKRFGNQTLERIRNYR